MINNFLPNVPVQSPPSYGKNGGRHVGKQVLCQFRFPARVRRLEEVGDMLRKAVPGIDQFRLLGAPPLFEGDEPVLVRVGPAEVEETQSRRLRLLNRAPKQQMHAAQMVEA